MKSTEKKKTREILDSEFPDFSLKDFEFSLEYYRKCFTKDDPNFLINLNDNYSKLFNLMKNSLHNLNNQVCILYGFPGFGRKSSIDFCINSLKNEGSNIKKIYIDASFYSTEPTFIKSFLQELYDQKPKKTMFNTEASLSFSNLFTLFKENKEKKEKIVLIIDRVEELVSIKKQTILYGLLEWIRNENNGIFLIFLTNNLMFCDLLEKRVKSRLSQTFIIFCFSSKYSFYLKVFLFFLS